jgi:hypothetical protein
LFENWNFLPWQNIWILSFSIGKIEGEDTWKKCRLKCLNLVKFSINATRHCRQSMCSVPLNWLLVRVSLLNFSFRFFLFLLFFFFLFFLSSSFVFFSFFRSFTFFYLPFSFLSFFFFSFFFPFLLFDLFFLLTICPPILVLFPFSSFRLPAYPLPFTSYAPFSPFSSPSSFLSLSSLLLLFLLLRTKRFQLITKFHNQHRSFHLKYRWKRQTTPLTQPETASSKLQMDSRWNDTPVKFQYDEISLCG